MKRLIIVTLAAAAAAVAVALAEGTGPSPQAPESAAIPAGAGQPVPPPSAVNGSWHKPPQSVLRQRLTPLQFEVTQENGTEPPFDNDYWNNHRAGIYVDVVSGEPLFSSTDKYESGTGWPSFTKPLAPGNILLKVDRSLGIVRTEVRSRYADSHLGHLFNDGPPPTGLRYCMDSAALRFVPVADMEREGYGEYLSLFEQSPAR